MSQISLRTLLDFTIDEERRSQELYRRAAELVSDGPARRFLEALLEEESRHEQELRAFASTVQPDEPAILLDAAALDSKAAEQGREDEVIEAGETARGLLLLALKREKRASVLYARMAAAAEEPSLREFLKGLSASEEGHAHRIREHFRLSG